MSYTVNVSLPKQLAELAKQHVKKGYYSSLSELIRDSLREKLLSDGDIPEFSMSKKREKIVNEAVKEYKAGKTHLLEDIEDMGKL